MLLRWAKLKPWRLRVLGLFMASLMLVIFFLPPSIFGTVLLGFLAAFLVIDGRTAEPEMFGDSRAQFIIVSIMGAAVWLKADRGVEIEYYKAAAQALPVLLLAFGLVAASFITFSVLAYKDAKLRAGRRTGSRQHSRHPSCRLDSHC
jgi:membrane-bound ClpP family serine protease